MYPHRVIDLWLNKKWGMNHCLSLAFVYKDGE